MSPFKITANRSGSSNLFALTFTLLMTGLLFSGQAFAVSDDGGLLDFDIVSGNATITGFTAGTSNTTPISNSNFSIY